MRKSSTPQSNRTGGNDARLRTKASRAVESSTVDSPTGKGSARNGDKVFSEVAAEWAEMPRKTPGCRAPNRSAPKPPIDKPEMNRGEASVTSGTASRATSGTSSTIQRS